MVVGSQREMLFSKEGLQWQHITLNAAKGIGFFEVCFDSGRYVAVGTPGALLSSTNGQDWQSIDPGTNTWLRTCAGGNGQYVVAAGNNTLLVSTNAQDWVPRAAPAAFVDLVYGSNRWVAVSGSNAIYTSPDLQDWTSVDVDPSARTVLNTVCFGGGLFIAGGAGAPDSPNGVQHASVVLFSSDGVGWSSASLSGLDAFGEIKSSAFAAGQFVAAQSKSFLRSTNGTVWEAVDAPEFRGTLQGIAGSAAGRFVAVGAAGALLRSDEARTWTVVSNSPRDEIQDMQYAGGRFVAVGGTPYYLGGPVGSAVVLTSINGIDWHASLTNLVSQLSAASSGNGQWVVCGDDGGIYTSDDAMNWTDHSLPPTTHDLRHLVYGNGRFVAFAASRDLVYHSANGADWVSADLPQASAVQEARFLNGRFTAVDYRGNIWFSDDGLTWTTTNVSATNSFEALAYGKGRYVIGGNALACSLNGTLWSVQSSPFAVRDLLFADGWFIAVGPNSEMMASRDGALWEPVDGLGLNGDYTSVLAYGNGVLVTGGYLNLYRSTLNDSEAFRKRLRLLSAAQLEFFGENGHEYRIEQSSHLAGWIPFSGWLTGTNQYLLWEAGPYLNSAGFWRAAGRPKP